MKSVLVALNPHAGATTAGGRIGELAGLLRQSGFDTVTEPDLGKFEARAAELRAQRQLHAVVAAGGDGTAAAVVNRLAADVPMALFPLGTENLLARAIGQKGTPTAVHDTLVAQNAVQYDAATANGRLFLIMLSAGFDAAVVQRAHELRRGHINRWHYFRPIREAIRGYAFPELRLSCTLANVDKQSVDARARWAFAFNMPCYAAGLPIAPHAQGADGALDVVTFERGSFWHGLRYLGSVILRRHHRMADFATLRVTRLRIEADDLVPYQVDGDPGGVLPVDVEVLPGRLCLLVPPRA
jgi:diacylglycerol kinase family enzyme